MPADPEAGEQLVMQAGAVYQQFKDKMLTAPQIIKDEIAASYESEPFLSDSAALQARLKHTEILSLFIASTLRAGVRNPQVLYITNTAERLRWYYFPTSYDYFFVGVKS